MCNKEEDNDMIAPATKPVDNIVVSERSEIETLEQLINNPQKPSDFIKHTFSNYKRNKEEE